MASSVGMKSFYREKKVGGVSGKRSSKAAVGSDPKTIIPDLKEDEYEEEKLRRFDLDMRYGPCIGMTRIERWDRASAMGLNPPADVEAVLLKVNGDGRVGPNECLWDGRV